VIVVENVDGIYKNVFTVDVEDWYHSTDLKIDCKNWNGCDSRIEDSTYKILDLLEVANIKGVFYVLSDIALQRPNLVRRIRQAGHELGSHGCTHRLVSDMTQKQFSLDIQKSRNILEDITGEKLIYYRAPVWSISQKNCWALELLDHEGFLCDSSMQPIKTPLSGDRRCPLKPFRPIINGKRLSIVEFPSTVLTRGPLRLPFAGGLFLRMMPKGAISKALHLVNKVQPGMVYVHPWEIDIDQPRVCKPFYTAITHYGNLRSTLPKLKILLENYQFITMKEFLETGVFPEHTIRYEEQGK